MSDDPPVDALTHASPAIDPHRTREWFELLIRTVLPHGTAVHWLPVASATRPDASLLPMMRLPRTPWKLESLATFYTPIFGPIDEALVDEQALLDIFRNLRNNRERPIDLIDLSPLCPDGRFYPLALQALRQAGWIVQPYFRFGNWYARPHTPGFEAYLSERPSALRNTIRRAQGRLERRGGLSMQIHTRPGPELERAIADYEHVYRRSWKRPEPHPQFIPELCRLAAAQGWLRLGVARLDRHPIAAQLWLVAGGRAQIAKLAYDPEHRNLSIGTVLTAHLMQHVLDCDRVGEIDYLIGDDAYKKDWMPSRRERLGLVAFHPARVRGLAHAARHFAGWLWRHMRPSSGTGGGRTPPAGREQT